MSKFYFAFVDSTEMTFGPEHQVEDAKVVDFSIDHIEGQIPTLSIDIKNPRIGLLNLGRKYWLWLSYDPGDTSGVVPLFFGRLVGIPTNLQDNKVTLSFIAKPSDYEAQKSAIAATMRVLPFFDPVFIDEAHRLDADAVLEAYSSDWHVDRTSLLVTTSDIIAGEDALEEFLEAEVPGKSVSTSLEKAPTTSVSLDATVNWPQAFAGTIDIGAHTFQTYTGDGLISDWPKVGATLSGGWSVAASSAIDVNGVGSALTANWSYNYQNLAKEHINGDVLSLQYSQQNPVLRGPFLFTVLTSRGQAGLNDPFSDPPVNIPATSQITNLTVPLWVVATSLTLAYGAGRNRTERVKFTLTSDLQPILADPDVTDTSEIITLNGVDVSIPIADDSSAGATAPLPDSTMGSYFPTDRGLRSLEYLISIARAHLLLNSRAVKVTFDCKFDRAINLSCRKNALLHDRRLPGGQALGKIVAYSIKCGSNASMMRGTITMACAVGFGNSISPVSGSGVYVVSGALESGIQQVTGDTVVVSDASDVGYSTPVAVAADSGLQFPLSRADAVISETVTGSVTAQAAAITASFLSEIEIANLTSTPATSEEISIENQILIAKATASSTANALKNNPITYQLELIDLTGQSFETDYDVTLTKLTVPKQIDLQAASF